MVVTAIGVVATFSPSVLQAQVAPDPLPPFASLPVGSAWALYEVSDLVGARVSLDASTGVLGYIWDLALVRYPTGEVHTLRYEIQSSEDYYGYYASTLADHPPGSVIVHALSDVYPSELLTYRDSSGEVKWTVLSSVPPGTIGSGGEIVNPGAIGGAPCQPVGIEVCASCPSSGLGCTKSWSFCLCTPSFPPTRRALPQLCPVRWGTFACQSFSSCPQGQNGPTSCREGTPYTCICE